MMSAPRGNGTNLQSQSRQDLAARLFHLYSPVTKGRGEPFGEEIVAQTANVQSYLWVGSSDIT